MFILYMMLKTNNVTKNTNCIVSQEKNFLLFDNLLIIWSKLKNDLILITSIYDFKIFYLKNYNLLFIFNDIFLDQNLMSLKKFKSLKICHFLNIISRHLFFSLLQIFVKGFWKQVLLNYKDLKKKNRFITHGHKYTEKGWFFKKWIFKSYEKSLNLIKSEHFVINQIKEWPKSIIWFLNYKIKLWLNNKNKIELSNIFLNFSKELKFLTQIKKFKNIISTGFYFIIKQMKHYKENIFPFFNIPMIKFHFFLTNLSKLKNIIQTSESFFYFNCSNFKVINHIFSIKFHFNFWFGFIGKKFFSIKIKNLINLFFKNQYYLILIKYKMFNKWKINFKFLNYNICLLNSHIKKKIGSFFFNKRKFPKNLQKLKKYVIKFFYFDFQNFIIMFYHRSKIVSSKKFSKNFLYVLIFLLSHYQKVLNNNIIRYSIRKFKIVNFFYNLLFIVRWTIVKFKKKKTLNESWLFQIKFWQNINLLLLQKYNYILIRFLNSDDFSQMKNYFVKIFKSFKNFSKKINFNKDIIKINIERISKNLLKFFRKKIYFKSPFEIVQVYSFFVYRHLLHFRIANNFNDLKITLKFFFRNYIFKLNKKHNFKIEKGFLKVFSSNLFFYFNKKFITDNFSLYFYLLSVK